MYTVVYCEIYCEIYCEYTVSILWYTVVYCSILWYIVRYTVVWIYCEYTVSILWYTVVYHLRCGRLNPIGMYLRLLCRNIHGCCGDADVCKYCLVICGRYKCAHSLHW